MVAQRVSTTLPSYRLATLSLDCSSNGIVVGTSGADSRWKRRRAVTARASSSLTDGASGGIANFAAIDFTSS